MLEHKLRLYSPRWVSRALWAPRSHLVSVSRGRGRALFVKPGAPEVCVVCELEGERDASV